MRAFLKDFFREFGRNKGRFISVFFIVLLGAAFFSGIRSNKNSMISSAEKYYNDSKMMDIKVQGTLGLTDDDVKDVSKIEGIDIVEGNYSANVLSKVGSSEQVVKMIGFTDDMNKPNITEGRLPKNQQECIVDHKYLRYSGLEVGDYLKVYSGTKKDISETLEYDRYKIVGVCTLPYYMDIYRGHASIGDGGIDSFALVQKDVFKSDAYTELNVRIKNSSKLGTYNTKYKKVVKEYTNKLDVVGKDASQRRYNTIYNEANDKIEEAENKIKDAEKKLSDAREEIVNGEKKLKDAKKVIKDKEKELKKAKSLLKSKENKFNTGKKTLASKEKELGNGKKLLAQKEKELKDAKKLIDKKEKELNTGKKILENKIKELDKAKKELGEQEEQFNNNKEELEKKKSQFEQMKPYMDEETIKITLEQIEQGEEQLKEGEEKLNLAKKQIEEADKEIEKAKKTISNGEDELKKVKNKIISGEKELVKGKKDIKNGEKQIKEAKNKIADGDREIKKAKTKIADGEKQINKGKKKIADSEEELREAKNKLSKEEKKANKEIKKAKKKVKDGKDELNKIKKPEWYVTTREDIYSCKNYELDASRVDSLGKVFPIIFFLVAALVSLTAMTRMVEEQRQQIGILEALGYSNFTIGLRYLSFALIPTITGSIVGVLVGEKIFPYVIINTYKMLYQGLGTVIFPYNFEQGILAVLLCTLCTGIATFTACNKAVRTRPSDLMRPKSPKLGRRVLLEKLPIWKHLSFSYKSTFRNLFRYKKRLCMTVLGVGGCMGLLIVALGLHDSIAVIAKNQFTKLTKYEVTVYLNDEESKEDIRDVYNTIKDYDNVDGIMPAYYNNIKVVSKDSKKTVLLTVPSTTKKFEKHISFNDYKTEEVYKFPQKGAVISQKTAEELKVSVGDEVELQVDGEENVKVQIKYIIENYIDHYIYISRAQYKELYNKDISINEYLVNINNFNSYVEKKFGETIVEKEAVAGLWFMSDTVDHVDDMMKSLNMVVYVLLISAGLLAFVVLYNLNNINIAERKRELATLKVLGFYDNEVSAYVYRENILLTALGIVAGLFIGTYLHHFIINSISMDGVMFGLKIANLSYIIGAIITIIFTCVVNFIMKASLNKIDMIESLKSVE